jgi:hypothetical protein
MPRGKKKTAEEVLAEAQQNKIEHAARLLQTQGFENILILATYREKDQMEQMVVQEAGSIYATLGMANHYVIYNDAEYREIVHTM